ncbi:MAG: hypothetical protein WDM86_02890 [Rhizomicrobium sp.]
MLFWSFNKLASLTEAQQIVDATGMEGLSHLVPVPDTDGWQLVHADHEVFYTLDELLAAYADEPTDGPEGASEASDDSPPTCYADAACVTPFDETDYSDEIVITAGHGADAKEGVSNSV